jgi:hypothetical protein
LESKNQKFLPKKAVPPEMLINITCKYVRNSRIFRKTPKTVRGISPKIMYSLEIHGILKGPFINI